MKARHLIPFIPIIGFLYVWLLSDLIYAINIDDASHRDGQYDRWEIYTFGGQDASSAVLILQIASAFIGIVLLIIKLA